MKSVRNNLLASLCCLAPFATAFNNNAAIVLSTGAKRSSIPILVELNAKVGCDDSVDNSRRSVFTAFSTALVVYSVIAVPSSAANAVYGADAKIELPNIAQGMADRANKQCLVESLGNRECLVYEDPDNKLYKSADSKILFDRLGSSIESLKRLPNYITNKQWSNVRSVLTGPMGSLSSTMNELVKLIDEESPVRIQCKNLSRDIRTDLYAINTMVDRKDGKQALVYFDKATEKLETFVQLVGSL